MPRSASSEKPIGQRMDTSRSAFSACLAPAASTRLMSACVDLVAAEIDRWPRRSRSSAGRPQTLTMSEFDGHPGHALGGVDGKPDRLLGPVEIDDDARFDAARFLVADADHLRPGGCGRAAAGRRSARLQPRDHAADLARADVEHGDDAGAARRADRFCRRASSYLRLRLCFGFALFLERGFALQLAASGVSWTTRRSARRMSTASDVARQQPVLAVERRRARRSPGPRRASGSLTVTPFSSRRSQRRSATRM